MWIYIKFVWPAEEHAVFLHFAFNFAWEKTQSLLILGELGKWSSRSTCPGVRVLISGWEASSSNWDHWLWFWRQSNAVSPLGRGDCLSFLCGDLMRVFPVHLVNPAASLIDIPISWGDWNPSSLLRSSDSSQGCWYSFLRRGLEWMNLLWRCVTPRKPEPFCNTFICKMLYKRRDKFLFSLGVMEWCIDNWYEEEKSWDLANGVSVLSSSMSL